jgi:DNA polymerase-3 subunit delta
VPGQSAKPVYVLNGDSFLRRQARQEIVRRLLGQDGSAGLVSFDEQTPLAEVLDELRTAPLLVPLRVVLVDPADEFVAAHASALEHYLAEPTITACLILCVEQWEAPAPLEQRVRQIGQVIDCRSSESGLSRQVAAAAERHGKKIAPAAAGRLIELLGNDLFRLDSEVEKLSLLAGQGQEISTRDVEEATVGSPIADRFDLVNAIRSGRTRQALELLGQLLVVRGDEFGVLAVLAWMVRDQASKQPQEHARHARNLRRLLKADLSLKSGQDTLTVMQTLVTALAARPAAARRG